MKREILTVKTPKPKRRHQFLFNDGEFKPRQENIAKAYRRREKHRGKFEVESMIW